MEMLFQDTFLGIMPASSSFGAVSQYPAFVSDGETQFARPYGASNFA